VIHIAPATAVFSAEIGVNPITRLLSPGALSSLPRSSADSVRSGEFFARLVSAPFASAIRLAFLIAAACAIGGALASVFRGARVAAGKLDRIDEASLAHLASDEGVTE
jgi:hypothetical protein